MTGDNPHLLYVGIHIMRKPAHMLKFNRLHPMQLEREGSAASLEDFVQFMEHRVVVCGIG